jgi:hypothetical protein
VQIDTHVTLCTLSKSSEDRYTCNAAHTVEMAVTVSEQCVTNCRINSSYRRCELPFLGGGGGGGLKKKGRGTSSVK